MNHPLSKILPSLCLLLAFGSAARAQTPQPPPPWPPHFPNASLGTPDGVPPSREVVCDGLQGASYGLCNAYCQAMDCDSGAPQASPSACGKVAGLFARITGQGLPCDCPCTLQMPGWMAGLNGELGFNRCTAITVDGAYDYVALMTDDGRVIGAISYTGTGTGVCGFDEVTGEAMIITELQAKACISLAHQKAAAAGITCRGPV